MILADKIINERKKNGWSQEELAERLSVSRQSVSKWEGAQAIPDIQKIIRLAELFHVSTDYLLKDELEPEAAYAGLTPSSEDAADCPLRKISLEEANGYLKAQTEVSPRIADGVSLCILSPALLILLSGLTTTQPPRLSENAAAGIGIAVLLLMVAAAVFLFITGGFQLEAYKYLETKAIDTAYGVSGMVSEKKKAYERKHVLSVGFGVTLCILCPLPLFIAAFLEAPEYVTTALVSLLLLLVASGVNLLVRTGLIWESYQKLLQEGDYTAQEKKNRPLIRKIGEIYWGITLVIYLGWSFYTTRWEFTWIVWPVAGVLFGVIIAVARMFLKTEE